MKCTGAVVATRGAALAEKLRVALDQALDTVRWASGLEFPDFHHDHEMLAGRHHGPRELLAACIART